MTDRWTLDALLTGKAVRFGPRGEASAIAKHCIDQPVAIGRLGLAGDEQADLRVHGGPDKAIHHYPGDHYAWWRTRLPAQPLLATVGAFGENVSTHDLSENAACLGDRYRMGTALVEIAQGRQPCWKQAHRLGDAGVVSAMVETQRCGWYYRVIEEGAAAAGDTLALVERPHPAWTVERTIAVLITGLGREPAAMAELAGLAVLAEDWRAKAARLA